VPPVVGAPVGALALHQVVIKGNAVAAPKGTAQGGGIYSTAPFTADHVVVTGNVPDNCSGTGC
jgi:putative cofactor-binding repeat protein